MLYKICSAEEWAACQREGQLPWSADDRRDGFIHLSSAEQLPGTAAKHFVGRAGLVVLVVDPDRLPPGALRWEVSRGGARFPHLYAELPREAVVHADDAPLGPDGVPRVPSTASGPSGESG